MPNDKLIALDFDGVLCDSINECLITSYNSYLIINEINSYCVYSLDKLPNDIKDYFLKFRPLAVTAREYYLLWDLFFSSQPIDLYQPISKQINVDDKTLDDFRKIFYQERKHWIETNIESWLKHNPIYPEILKCFDDLFCNPNLIILSAKDSDSIKYILKHAGIVLPDNNIYGSASGKSKIGILKTIISKYNVSSAYTYFLDDSIENLFSAREIGVNLFLADWGYVFPHQIETIKQLDIEVVSQMDFHKWAKRYTKV